MHLTCSSIEPSSCHRTSITPNRLSRDREGKRSGIARRVRSSPLALNAIPWGSDRPVRCVTRSVWYSIRLTVPLTISTQRRHCRERGLLNLQFQIDALEPIASGPGPTPHNAAVAELRSVGRPENCTVTSGGSRGAVALPRTSTPALNRGAVRLSSQRSFARAYLILVAPRLVREDRQLSQSRNAVLSCACSVIHNSPMW